MFELSCHLSKPVSEFSNLCQVTFVHRADLNSCSSHKDFTCCLQMIVPVKNDIEVAFLFNLHAEYL